MAARIQAAAHPGSVGSFRGGALHTVAVFCRGRNCILSGAGIARRSWAFTEHFVTLVTFNSSFSEGS